MSSTLIAGPRGEQLDNYLADPFTYLRGLQEHGDIVGIELGGIPTAVIYDLGAISTVFADKLDHIGRPLIFDRIAHVMGSGLITNYDWETWFPRRRRIVKPLGARAVGQFHERMCSIIDDELGQWPVDEEFELHDKVKRLTLRIVADLLFTSDLTEEAIVIIDTAVQEIHAWAEADPGNDDVDTEPASFTAAIGALDAFINDVIDSRSADNPGDDMVGLLLAGIDDPEAGIDRKGVRDEAVTLILAGHETVTNTICFGIDLLGRNSAADGSPGSPNVDARNIVDETLRLYPPVHVTNRAVVKDLDLGTTTLTVGWEVLIPEYVLYRDERYFERPDEFLPERWDDDSPLQLERKAYFPFLTGPKFCVGRHFAILEATEALDRFRTRFTHEMLDPEPPWGREFATSFAPDRPLPITLALKDPKGV